MNLTVIIGKHWRQLMGNGRKMILGRNVSFCVYTALRNYSFIREGRKLQKLIRNGEQRSLKKKPIPKSTSLNTYARNVLYSPVKKRVLALNKVFNEHVCDLTALGEYSSELDRLGIEIVETRISPNFRVLFIYWIDKKPYDEEEVLKFLPQVAANLRTELSTLKVMGQVPEVRFAKHKMLIEMERFNEITKKLDSIKSLEKEIKRNENDHFVNDDISSKLNMVLSKVKQNIFGLDYSLLFENIKNKTKKEPCVWEREHLSAVSTNDMEKVRFDKKVLSKMICKERSQYRKQRKLNKMLLNNIEMERNSLDENEQVEYPNDFDDENNFYDEMKRLENDSADEYNQEYDDSDTNEEMKRILHSHGDENAEKKP